MKQQLLTLLLFSAMAIVLRFFSFFPTVINHDESTYIVIADALLNGKIYFVDYIDTKPVGIFILLAAFMSAFGKSIFVLRLVTSLWLALTAYLLYRVHKEWGSSERVGIASGVIYLFLNSIYTFYGISPNTESYFNLFTILTLLLIIRQKGFFEYFIGGVSLGIGFIIKYVVAFDGLAFALFLLIQQIRKNKDWGKFFSKAAGLAIGFFLVFGGVCWYYYQLGAIETFFFHTYDVPRGYPKVVTLIDYIKFPIDFLLRNLPVTLFFIFTLCNKNTSRDFVLLSSLWSVCVLAVILLPGNWYGHYWIQFMLPFSFVAGHIFDWPKEKLHRWIRPFSRPQVGYTLLGLLVSVNLVFQKQDYFDKPDYPKMAANYLKERLNEGDTIYTGNFAQIIYHLVDRSSPTKYVHPSLFWEQKHIKTLQMDLEGEIDKVKASQPRFVLQYKEWRDDRFIEWLENDYQVVKEYPARAVTIYERRK